MRRAFLCLCLTLLLLFRSNFKAAADTSAGTALHQLFDSDWEYAMAHNPVRASLAWRSALQ